MSRLSLSIREHLVPDPRRGSQSEPPSKYILEAARTLSIEMHSEPVLCTRFLPWMDLSISAAGDIWGPTYSSPGSLSKRLKEVIDLVHGTKDVLQARTEWCRAVVSFGLMRWWPVSVRDRASRSLGPFKVEIDCEDFEIQINDSLMLEQYEFTRAHAAR